METSTPFTFAESSTELMLDDLDTNGTCELIHPDSIMRNVMFRSIIYSGYAIIFVIGLVGNTFVCYVVMSSPRMKTVTNYFIMNLAVGDMLITLLCVPFTVVALLDQYWSFGTFMCPLVSYVTSLSVFVSAYTLVAISIDKYMLIMWPLKPRISKRSATAIIGLVWLIAGTTVLPTGTFSRLVQPTGENNSRTIYHKCDKYLCQEDFSSVGLEYHSLYTTVLMVLQYIIPCVVLLFTYVSIAVVVWCHRIPGEAENIRDKRLVRSKRKMIKMMVIVVCVYTICWLPYNVLLMTLDSIEETIMPFIYFPTHALAMSHTCYNPIIYCYMNARFREGLFVLLRAIPCLKSCYIRTARDSSSSSFPHQHALESKTSTTGLQRNNTSSTYISLTRKNRMSTHQIPVRSASLMGGSIHTTNNNGRRKRAVKDFADEQI
ncbi:RYamide receptor-like [Cylas formicarius]|uniref:RYamide receptor-like n=1 Tax=Cylas formicarius TaxID=197179 RepID=UPI00295849FB|nr:RYamide receptor-like [Cylas formicarius]